MRRQLIYQHQPRRFKFKLLGVLFVIGTFLYINHCTITPVWAEDTTDFGVQAITNQNQTKDISNYFDMTVEPNQTYPLKVSIMNNSNKDQAFDVIVNQATTSDGGAIDYGTNKPKLDKSLKYQVVSMVDKVSQKVTIPANSSQEVDINITAPKESFEGIILGGINISKVAEKDKASESKEKKMIIRNKIKYSLAIVLRSEDQPVASNMNLLSVKPGNDGAHPAINVRLQNPQPKILPDLKVKATVHRKGEEKTLLSSEKSDMKMAPNSNFTYVMSYQDTRMKAGKYVINIEANSKADKWKWTEEFTITDKEAKTINDNSVFEDDEESGISWLTILLIIIVILLLLIIAYVIYKKQQDEKNKRDEK